MATLDFTLNGMVSKVPVLDSSGFVPTDNLPDHLPKRKRIWRDVKVQRTVGTWYTNSSGNEMELHIRASVSGTSNRFISIQLRENSSSTTFVFNSTVLLNLGSTGITYADSGTITIPSGWEYRLASVGGSTDTLTERWYELS